MNSNEIIEKVKNMTIEEQRNLSYEEIGNMVNMLTADEIIEVSNAIGYKTLYGRIKA